METFEQFLEEKYDEINSNSNNMNKEFESARDSWFENLDVQELIDYGQEFATFEYNRGVSDMHKEAKDIINKRLNISN